jgi:hypothetical protein
MPSRRTYLATMAAVGAAGCLDKLPGSAPKRTTADSPSQPATEPTPEHAVVDVTSVSITHSVRYVLQFDHNGVYTAEGRQFVFLTVDDVGTPTHTRSAFSVVADGESYWATTFRDNQPHAFDPSKRAYRRDADPFEPGREGWLCFVVPTELDSLPELRLESEAGTWQWPLSGAERALAPPPAWELSVDAPETVPPKSTFEIEVSATNVGDGAGRFRGAVNFKNLSYHTETVGLSLAPGESGAAAVEAESGDAGETFNYGVQTAAGDIELAVDIESEPSSATPTSTK